MDPAKILIVEDNTTVAEDSRECLEGLGYSVTAIAASGEEAVESAGKDRPDAVLMDIKLRGDMDGIEAADRIHTEFDIPVLFLSAYSDRELLGRAKKTGSFGYLVKPFEERELYAMLEMTLYKARVEKERREMEERLARVRKMAAIGRMAAGIAHNFNNTLYVALGNLEIAREELPPESEALGSIVEAEKATQRAAAMSRLMLTYLGHEQIGAAPINLALIVDHQLRRLRESFPAGIHIQADLPDPGPVVAADGVAVGQVLQALLVNAAEAMVDDSPARVTVSIEETPSSSIRERHRFPADWEGGDTAYACLSVADNGKGMDGKTIDAVFDPFFTDKFTGRGLGLAVVLGMVKAHGGCITVESAPEQGSVFQVFLPLSSEPIFPTEDKADVDLETVAGEGAVLVVDDQDSVREMTRMMVCRLGFSVIAASSGKEAAAIFRDKPDGIRLVISDLTMPGLDGWQTLAELRKIRPDIPVILMSGYDKSQAMAGDHAEQPQAFLQKPCRRETLKKTIHRVLGQKK